eukprot:m.27915 g.27915  ORF g.27915 m.27915 type:complete len:220 (-) comp11968_c0_seq1:1359-2018(-)
MSDDLDVDALLDDLDGLCTDDITAIAPKITAQKIRQSAPISKDSKKSSGRVVEEEGNDLDADLQDALDDLDLIELEDHTVDCESVKPPIREATHGGAATSSSGLVVGRCDPTVLGGSTIPMGQGSRSDSKACNMLRCISCDFKVCWFDNYSWHPRSDYLFFRNGCTDPVKLNPNLVVDVGSRAYACQCAWASVLKTSAVTATKRVEKKWRCLPGTRPHP